MSAQLSFDPARSALLCMDYQNGILANIPANIKDSELLPRAANLLHQARLAGLPVLYIQVGFRPNLPEISPRNAAFSGLKTSPQYRQMFAGPGQEIHPDVAPQENDIVIVKRRVSAFAGTDLDIILRARDIDTLILFGISTSGVVLSTVRHAADADFRLIVVKDCCVDPDLAVHACLTEKVFPRQATVVPASEFIGALVLSR
jgi:nicotinamidase-related amidase